MYKKQVLSIMLILWFAVQFSFAESVTFKSNSKSEDGNPLVLNGILTKPEGKGPFPAIVLLHGCRGVQSFQANYELWASRLVGWGYVALIVDSFVPRSINDVCYNPLSSTILRTRSHDAYDAKAFLSKLPYVDRNRIAVMGWSHGGITVLTIVNNLYEYNSPFKAAIAFYPFCSYLFQPNAPLMILIGESDDWTPAYKCPQAIPSMETEHEIILKIYPGAYHNFDFEGMDELYRGHRLKYDPIAAADAIVRVKDFLAKYFK